MPPAALGALIQAIGGASYAPAPDAVAALAARPRPATLGGVRLLPAGRLGPGLLVVREAAAMAPPTAAVPGAMWDGRYRLDPRCRGARRRDTRRAGFGCRTVPQTLHAAGGGAADPAGIAVGCDAAGGAAPAVSRRGGLRACGRVARATSGRGRRSVPPAWSGPLWRGPPWRGPLGAGPLARDSRRITGFAKGAPLGGCGLCSVTLSLVVGVAVETIAQRRDVVDMRGRRSGGLLGY